jgi:hypothetical protein
MHFDDWRLVHSKYPVVMEVALLDTPVLQPDLAIERGREAGSSVALIER